MKRLKHSLFRQMVLLGSIILCILTVTYTVTLQYVKKTSRDSVVELNDQILIQVQGKAEEFYNSMNHVATTLVYSPTVYRYFTMDSVGRVASIPFFS